LLFGREATGFQGFRDDLQNTPDDQMLTALEALAGDGVTVDTVDTVGLLEAGPRDAQPPALAARIAKRTVVDGLWRRTSFTGLTRGEMHGPPLPTDDEAQTEEEAEAEDLAPPEPETTVALHDFRAGALVGTCLHHILEHHDFTEPDALVAQVTQSMALHGLDPTDEPKVSGALQAALDTAFGGHRLADLPTGDRLNELSFTFAVAGGLTPRRHDSGAVDRVTRNRLADVYDAHGRPVEAALIRALSFEPFGGFLTGSVDLVYRVGGRWHLADYKSNHLGPAPSDYLPERLAEAMHGRHYFLQAHLYTVALHRHLSFRLEDYDYERDMGAAWYLFLRGMDPANAPGTGVHRERLSAAMVGALSEALS
jgi:exodeoxyribonuclease V beta subunit